MFHVNFGGMNFDGFEGLNEVVEIEVQLGNQIVNKVQTQLVFAKNEFANAIQQISRDSRPMQIKCIRYDYADNGKKLENSLVFRNLAFVSAFDKEEESSV